MAEKTCPFCAETIKADAIKCRFCGSATAPAPRSPALGHPGTFGRKVKIAALGGIGFVILFAVCVAAIAPVDPKKPKRATAGATAAAADTARAECEAGAQQRKQWIAIGSAEMSGYSSAMFNISAVGVCGTDLRVREDDCSVVHLVEAYGNKPFMKTARSLGFTSISCRYDEYPLSAIIGQ